MRKKEVCNDTGQSLNVKKINVFKNIVLFIVNVI